MRFFRILAPLIALTAGTSAWAFTLGGTSSAQLGWATRELTFDVNPTDCGISETVLNRAVDAAIEIWNSVPTSGLVLKRNGEYVSTLYAAADAKLTARANGNPSDLPPANPEIICSLNFEADTNKPGAAEVIGGTTQYIAPDSPYLEYAYITLNSETNAAASLSEILDTAGESALKVLIAHEMGHALGLGHTGDPDALMYFAITEKLGLSLSQDDIDGITYLYPRSEFGGDGLFGCGFLRRKDGGGPGNGSASGAISFFGLLLILGLTARAFKFASARV